MKVLAIIPARYASTRFPGKPLALLGGRTIIEHVWQRVSGTAAVDRAIVATDDDRIMQAVAAFGGEAMMTSSHHQSGTDRCGEVMKTLEDRGERYDIVINVQGDEPFIEPSQIEALIDCFTHSGTEIATLKTLIHSDEELLSPNNVKVVCANDGKALYFSRLPIPYLRNKADRPCVEQTDYYKHVGIYAFRTETLKAVCRLQPGRLEQCEKLEQLRWLEAGYCIEVRTTQHANIGIDTPDDLVAAEKVIKQGIKR